MISQRQQYWEAHRKIADGNQAFMDMVNCKENPLTKQDLEALIKRRPEVYSRFAGLLDKLPDRGHNR